ncbi:hypothetical protein NDL37_004524 [Vibrio parahaemolyticus]|nr:hypothetical protein [Vibrio parahaemolyticus]
MNYDQELAHRIKLKFGTAPEQPNAAQLNNIKRDIQALVDKGKVPNEDDWFEIVKKYCPDAGNYVYLGADNSDLITLMQLATKK